MAISDEEWQLRCELADCYQAFVAYGWTDTIFTHLSARVPGVNNQYLINPFGLLFEEITAENLIKVDFDGNVVAGDYPYNDAGHAIHHAVLKARPDVNVALHSHTRAGMAVSCMADGLLPLTQQANEIRDLLCYHQWNIAGVNDDECDKLAADLGDRWIMIMHNHGLLAVGRNIAEAFYYLYTVENACKVQVDVLASGQRAIVPASDLLDQYAKLGLPEAQGTAQFIIDNWQAVRRKIARNAVAKKT